MVSPVTASVPYSYLNVLNPSAAPALPVAAVDSTSATSSSNASTTPASTTPASTTPAATPSTNNLQLSPEVLAILQGLSPNATAASSLSSLLGGGSSSSASGFNQLLGVSNNDSKDSVTDAIDGYLSASIYKQALGAAYSGAQAKSNSDTASVDPLQNILSAYHTAINATNTAVNNTDPNPPASTGTDITA